MKLGTILQLLAATMLWPVDLPAQSFTMLCGLTNYNTEGAFPVGGLILAGDTLYGTAEWGGCFGGGTLIKVNTNGSGFTVLHNFAGPDGDLHAGGPGFGNRRRAGGFVRAAPAVLDAGGKNSGDDPQPGRVGEGLT